jgi:hypothetical protein
MTFFPVTLLSLKFAQKIQTQGVLLLVLHDGRIQQGPKLQHCHKPYFWFPFFIPYEHSRKGIHDHIFHTTSMFNLNLKRAKHRIHLTVTPFLILFSN